MKKQLMWSILALVSFNYLMALAQYKSGPSGLAKTVTITASTFTNLSDSTAKFPVSGTNVDIWVYAQSSNGLATFTLTIGVDKSQNGVIWSNAGIFTTSQGAASPGALMTSYTQYDVGPYGWVRVRGITNNAATTLTNIQVLATHK